MSENNKLDAFFYEVDGFFCIEEVKQIAEKLPENFFYSDIFPIEGDNSICYAFISEEMSEKLNYRFDSLIFSVRLLMNDMNLENKREIYEFLYDGEAFHYGFTRNYNEFFKIMKSENKDDNCDSHRVKLKINDEDVPVVVEFSYDSTLDDVIKKLKTENLNIKNVEIIP